MLKRSLFYWDEDKLLEDESAELTDSSAQNETKILGHILTFLEAPDIFNFRLVCKTFNKTLLNQPEALWNKSRIIITEQDPTSWKHQPQPLLSLINDLLCPNFHFKNLPLHAVSSFLSSFETVVIRHVKLTCQEFSTAQLYHFLNLCPSVEYLEIIGDPAIYSDSIDKWDLYRKDPVLQMINLKTLILKSSAASSNCSTDTTHCRYPPTNLSPGFLASLTSLSYVLETVEMAGFPFASFLALSKIFYHDFGFSRIQNLICTDIISRSTSADDNPSSNDNSKKNDIILFLETLQQLHLSIKKLVIGFHPNSKVTLNEQISAEIGKTSVYYGDSIEELTIVNCPVSEHIFEATMPNLKKLVLHKTSAANVSKIKQLKMKKPVGVFPKLQFVIFSESPAVNERPSIDFINDQETFAVSKMMQLISYLFWEKNMFPSRGNIFILLGLILFGMLLIEKVLMGVLPPSSSSPWMEQIRMFIHVSAIYGHIVFVGRKQAQGPDPIIH